MAEEQFRLTGTVSGAVSRIPGDFADREEMMDAVAEAQALGKYDSIGVQKRTKNATTGKFSSWVDVESFAGNRHKEQAVKANAGQDTDDVESETLPEKITYCVQAKQDGKWQNILVTEDKMEAAKRTQAEMNNPKNEEISFIQ